MNWNWFHKFASPKWFYQISDRILPGLCVVTFSLLFVGLIWGIGFAPADAKQGNSFRIIYLHVPSSFLALAGYFLMAIAGAIGLIWRIKLSFWVMKCAAPIGGILTLLALVTGGLWGKPTWGSFWVWDARATSMLILLFLYIGVYLLGRSFQNLDSGDKASAFLSIIGTVNIPIIYKSVDWWFTLHQPATINFTSAPSMHPDMFFPLFIMIIAFYLVYGLALTLSLRVEILSRERKTKWVRKLISQQ